MVNIFFVKFNLQLYCVYGRGIRLALTPLATLLNVAERNASILII